MENERLRGEGNVAAASGAIPRSRRYRRESIEVLVGFCCPGNGVGGPKCRCEVGGEPDEVEREFGRWNWSVGCLKTGCGNDIVREDVGRVERVKLPKKGGDRWTATRPGVCVPPAMVSGKQAGRGRCSVSEDTGECGPTGDVQKRISSSNASRRAESGEEGDGQLEDAAEEVLLSSSSLVRGGERLWDDAWRAVELPNQRKIGS